jgi:protoporphyrinogen oxidase
MSLGFSTFGKACFEILKTKFQRKILDDSFESFALATYGRTIAEAFLLKYSEKLWGAPCHQLSRMISGKRLQGLDVKTFIKETLLGHRAKTQHLDGAFYYPKMGYGMIVERLAEICGQNNIVTNARITKIYHTHSSIQALEINGKARVDVQEVVSSLPLDLFLQMMEPSPVKEVQDLARSLLYRNVILVAFFLNKEFVTKNASLYFPNPFFPFTRVYEPKQRSSKMSPTGKTSLIAEIPCQYGDEIWSKNDNELIELVLSKFLETQLIQENEVIDSLVKRLAHAYPILELGYENKIEKITNFLNGFNNLKLSGRNGKFMYTHLHDMMRFGKELVQDFISEQCVIPASAHLNIH